jgi:hypothetical protein
MAVVAAGAVRPRAVAIAVISPVTAELAMAPKVVEAWGWGR